MTDDADDADDTTMDARLAAAGARWRGAHTDIPATADAEVFPAELTVPQRPRRRRGLYASIAAVAAVLVAGSAITIAALNHHDRSTVAGSEITGTVWVLDGRVGEHSSATLHISSDGLLVADDSCAVVSATVENLGDGRLEPTDIRERDRDCTDQYGPKLGSGFIDALTHAPRFTVDGDTLTIGSRHFTANRNLPVPTTDVPTFTEAKWRLIHVQDRGGRDLPVPKDADLQVRSARFSASDGCNELSGDIAVDGGRVDTKAISSTAVGCSGRNAPTIDDVLTGSFRQTVRGNTLTITHAGAGTLIYTWVPDDRGATDPAVLVGPEWFLATSGDERAIGMATLRLRTSTSYAASDGCRTFTGSAVVEHGAFRLRGIPTSKPDCAPAASAQAETTDSYLHAALWSVRSGRLGVTPFGAQADSLVYTNNLPVQPTTSPVSPLAGKWQLSGVDRTRGNSASGRGGSDLGITLTIAHGRYGVTGLCAPRSGAFTRSGDRLELSVGAEDYCVTVRAPGDYVESVFATDGTVAWSVRGTELTLRRGAYALTFARA